LNSLRDGLQRLDASGFHPAYEPLNQAAGEISHTLGPLLQADAIATESVRGTSSPMRVVNASLGSGGPLNRVLDSIESLDIDTIKSRLLQTQQNLRSDALETRNQIISLNAATKEMSDNRIVVDAISPVRTAPADAGPRPAMLLMFGLFAIAFGAAVAFRYKPELVDVGFDSADDAARSIGLPLVSTIRVDLAEVAGRGKKDCIANSIVRVCEIGLTGFVLLTVVLCLTIPEIRSAFVENPIFGLSRIGELFFGS
jgi:hypothetical protein